MRRFSITKHRRLCNPLAYFPAAVVLVIATLTGWSSAFAVEEKPPLPRWRNLSESEAPSVPEPRREFRGVWIATVYNLDWPSKPGLPVETQQAELLDILDVVIKVCDALAFAHNKGVLHCDVKPANVMVGEFGEVHVVDWGIAVALADRPSQQIVGTPAASDASPSASRPWTVAIHS